MELCIGTVQFGMDYGILGNKKPLLEDAVRWLDYATQNGIYAIDTARAYGTAEEVIGAFLSKKTISRERLFISTKFMPNILDDYKTEQYETVIENELTKQLKILKTNYVDVYMYHSSQYAFDEDKLAAISCVKQKGIAKKVGISVYNPEEAFACFDNSNINCIQAPYSIFDHRMKENDVFQKGHEAGFNIDVRTVFIKGLIRLEESEVPCHLAKAKPILRKLDALCKETGYSRIELAMGYVKRETLVNHLVFGVRSLEQLKEDIESFKKEIPDHIFDEIDKEFSGIDADLVVPSLWVK